MSAISEAQWPAPAAAVRAEAASTGRWRAYGYAGLFWFGFYALLIPPDCIEDLQTHANLARDLSSVAIDGALWTLAAPLAMWLVEHYPVEGARRWSHLGVHVAYTLAVTPLLTAASYLGVHAIFGARQMMKHEAWPMWRFVLAESLYILFVYLGFVAILHAARFLRRNEERERLLAQAQVQALKAQLNPHFLYNTLNAVSEFAYKDAATAERLITMLSDLLRLSFAGGDAPKVPLAEEMGFVRRYLDIQQLLLEDRLQVRYAFEPGALRAQVPNFILQPLVENAVVHGISRRAAAGHIELGGSVDGGVLRLWVKDDGPGLAGTSPRGHGIGLSHTRARLAQLYGGAQRLDLDSPEGGGFSAQLRLPYEQVAAP